VVQQGAGFHCLELDQVAVVGVGGLSGEAGEAHGPGGQDREERLAVLGDRLLFRHFFASLKTRVSTLMPAVKLNFFVF
jgi:hypothetical protein